MSQGGTLVMDYNGNVEDIKPKISRTKRPNYQRHLKLPDTYSRLIAMAIKESKNRMVTLHEIQAFLKARYACFNGSYTGWKNSLRHNLSANPAFIKVLRDDGRPRGKDNYWTLDESVPIPGKDRDAKPKLPNPTSKRKRCPIAKSEKISKARALPFSIENLLRPTEDKKPGRDTESPPCLPSSTTDGYGSAASSPAPKDEYSANRPCHRVQMVPSIGPCGGVPIWGHVGGPTELYHCDERIPVCYSDRFRDEEIRNSRLSLGSAEVRRMGYIKCELEGCEMNHQEELIVCELENCNVCKPWPTVKREAKNMYTKNPLQYIPRYLDSDLGGEPGGEVPFDFSQYEVDTGRLENLRESLEVKACGGVKAARIREED